MSNNSPSLERVQVKLPAGFVPSRHSSKLADVVSQRHGEGFRLQDIDEAKGVATFVRGNAVTTVSERSATTRTANLARDTKPSDAAKIAALYEDQLPGFYMTDFDPYLFTATFTQMDAATVRCRGAVANALGVKPWDVKVTPRPDKGFDIGLPKSYTPSKHDDKLSEVATEIVGRDGWRFRANAANLTAEILPGEPPTFPAAVKFPLKQLSKVDRDRWTLGMTLPDAGVGVGQPMKIDWTQSAWTLLFGTPGSGKAASHDTLVPTPNGWVRHGDLKVGDEVFTPAGHLASVTDLSGEVVTDTYRLTFSDGQSETVSGDHLWSVSTRASRLAHGRGNVRAKRDDVDARHQAKIGRLEALREQFCAAAAGGTLSTISTLLGVPRTTLEKVVREAGVPYVEAHGKSHERHYVADELVGAYLDHLRGVRGCRAGDRQPLTTTVDTATMFANQRLGDDRVNYAVPVPSALDLPEADLPLDPYILGAWLGDGASHGAQMFADPSDQPHLLAQFERANISANISASDPLCVNARGLRTRLRSAGVLGDKRIPMLYLRASCEQRLALLAGLMDTDGSVNAQGGCELTLCKRDLAHDALELIRSLGIVASLSESDAAITEDDPSTPGMKRRRVTGTRYRIHFTTTQQVFRLPRKADRLPTSSTSTSQWLYVEKIEKVEAVPARCIRIDDPDHLYLIGGFIPTHNTVTINSLIAQALASGCELVIVDDAEKSVDFLWCKDFVRPGGWGCDSEAASATALALAYEEGKRRSAILKERNVVNWTKMPKGEQFKPWFIVVDEVSALLVQDPVPRGVPKDHPIVMEINEKNFVRALIGRSMSRIVAEQRFVGSRMVASTQVGNAQTGMPPSLKNKFGHVALQGTAPSKSARNQSFADESIVPTVPQAVQSSGDGARGVGVATLTGSAPGVYKSLYEDVEAYREALLALGVPTTTQPAPTAEQITKYASLDSDEAFGDDDDPGTERTPSGKPLDPKFGPVESFDADGKKLFGAAAAASASKTLASSREPASVLPKCPSCGRPIQIDGSCGCTT